MKVATSADMQTLTAPSAHDGVLHSSTEFHPIFRTITRASWSLPLLLLTTWSTTSRIYARVGPVKGFPFLLTRLLGSQRG